MQTRRSARLVLLDNQSRILLIKIEDDNVHAPGEIGKRPPFWVTPGGRVEEGESYEAALSRELREETGLTSAEVEIGPCLWFGEKDLMWCGELTRVHDSFYYARTRRTTVTLESMTADERQVYRDHQWWIAAEMKTSGEIFLPKDLPALLGPILRGELPNAPVEIDLTNPQPQPK